jgi:hypothetical protein
VATPCILNIACNCQLLATLLLLMQARESLGLGATLPEDVPKGHKVDKFFEEGLQQWAPESYR